MQSPTIKVSTEARQVFRKLSSKLTTPKRRVSVKDILEQTAKKLKSGEWKLDVPEK